MFEIERGKMMVIAIDKYTISKNTLELTKIFFLGVYLTCLCTMDAIYQGIYCQESLKWLQSTFCTYLGFLVVLASQLSVLTLASLAAIRLVSVINVSIIYIDRKTEAFDVTVTV